MNLLRRILPRRPPRTTARDYREYYWPIVHAEIEAWLESIKPRPHAQCDVGLTRYGDLDIMIEYEEGNVLHETSMAVPFLRPGVIDRAELHKGLAYWILGAGRQP